MWHRSLFQHFFYRHLILIPFFPVAPILIRYLPALLRSVLPVLKSRKLRLLVYLDPELYYYRAPVLKLPLELIYLIVGSCLLYTSDAADD